MNAAGCVALAVVRRGDGVENVHFGAIAVVDRSGSVRASAGDPEQRVYARSSLKPFQALPLAAHARFESLRLDEAELAVICGSHSGEPRHVQAVLAILAKCGCRKEQLRCGIHPPFYLEARGERPAAGDVFTPLQHNCSGKHAGMLALGRLLQATTEDYAEAGHPVQRRIRTAVARYARVEEGALEVCIDGCGVPNYALPLRLLAGAYARLGGYGPDPDFDAAPGRIAQAMTAHPAMVAGIKRLDLALMHCGRGDWIAKSGAEGVRGLSVRGRGLGIAIKVADGNARVRDLVTLEVLRQLGLPIAGQSSPLEPFLDGNVHNVHGTVVGRIETQFTLRGV
jgi:L-asparaginase II